MDKLRNAAIILLGMGDKYAADILKHLNQHEIATIIEQINEIGAVSEYEVIVALNEFFKEVTGGSGIDLVTKAYLKNSLNSAVEHGKMGSLTEGLDSERARWIDQFKQQSVENIVSIIQDEHPQIIAVIATIILTSEKASKVIKHLPKDVQKNVIIRMTHIGSIAKYSMEAISEFFEMQLINAERYNAITVDGVEAVVKIISHLDGDAERDLLANIADTDKNLYDQIEDKIFPFERLAQLDKKSLQVLLKEAQSEDLVLALKGADDLVKNSFLKNMSQKAAEILKDDMESKGPVKLAAVVEAQKRLVLLAKKLAEEEKIIIPSKNTSDIVV